MRWDPHPFQIKSARHIIQHQSSMLFLRMGFGKTAITLTAIDWLLKHQRITGAMIFGPVRVIYNSWPDEIEKWNHLRHLSYTILHGKHKDTRLSEPHDIYLINYEGIKWFYRKVTAHHPTRLKANFAVFDESVKIKSHNTKRSAMLRWLKQFWDYRVGLTGTPAPNSILDIFGQYLIIDDGARLGTSYKNFQHKYFMPVDYNAYKWVPKPKTIPILANKVRDITVRLTKSDHIKLPKVIENSVTDRLPDKLQDQYDELEREFFLQIDNVGIEAFNAASLSMKLRQFMQGAIYYDQDKRREFKKLHELKLDMIEEIIEDYQFPTIIAIQFRFERELLKQRFPHAVTDVTVKNSRDIVQRWNDQKIELLVVHPASMAEGLNLQHGGHVIIWAALPWSSSHYDQLNSRIVRQGQKNIVTLHHVLFKNTIETRVLAALKSKISNQAKFIEHIRDLI